MPRRSPAGPDFGPSAGPVSSNLTYRSIYYSVFMEVVLLVTSIPTYLCSCPVSETYQISFYCLMIFEAHEHQQLRHRQQWLIPSDLYGGGA